MDRLVPTDTFIQVTKGLIKRYHNIDRATNKQQVDVVDFLLNQSLNQPLRNLGNGDTPLVEACRHGNIKLVDLLLSHSPQLMFVSDEENSLSPLHVSSSRGDKGLVQLMLQTIQSLYDKDTCHKHINMMDKIGRTPFYNACYHGQLSVVKSFLDFKHENPDKLDINAEEKSRRTPLHAAVSAPKNSKEIVELLLKETELNVNAEAHPSSRSQRLLRKILEHKRSVTSTVSLRSLTSPSIEIPPRDIFETTTTCETPVTICSFVSDDVDVDFGIMKHENTTPIQPLMMQSMSIALRPLSPSPPLSVVRSSTGVLEVAEDPTHGYTPFSKLLLTPLAEACIFRSREIAEMLINHGAIDKNGYACQLAYIIQRLSLVHLILARQCQLKHDLSEEDKPSSIPMYQLRWDEKHLQAINGKWLTSPLFSFDLVPMLEMGSLICQPITFNQLDSTLIHTVCLQRNNLQTVPVELFQLPNVQEIDLSRNMLYELPDESEETYSHTGSPSIWKCDQLCFLNLHSNRLESLPYMIWCLLSLERIIVSKNLLKSLVTDYPVEDGPIPDLSASLKEIDLSHNRLEIIEDDLLFCLPQVNKIKLSNNLLRSLPSSLWDCETLQNLDLSNNCLSSLPKCNQEELIDSSFTARSPTHALLQLATTLHVAQATFQNDFNSQASAYGGGHLSQKPKSKNKKSTTGTRDDFIIHQIDEKLDHGGVNEPIIEICDYSTLTHLLLASNRFEIFPPGLPCLAPNLTMLDISNNPLQTIDVAHLSQSLRKLSAKECMLERFGNTLTDKQLKSVRKQCYHDNTSPDCIHRSHLQLQYLQTLELQGNKLKRFQLIKCDLKRNTKDPTKDEIEFLPNCSTLHLLYPSLEGIDLSRNCLVDTFNPNIGRQTQLKWIKLGGNVELKRLPLQLALLKNTRKLTEVNIKNLPNLVEPPRDYQDDIPLSQLLTYMRSRLKE